MDRTRVILFASVVAAAMVFGGVLGATVLARSTYTPASAALAATSPAPAATSNEATAHEAGESAAQEAAENNGTARPHGPGAGGSNEDPAHEAVEKLEGNATTDFGAPGIPAKGESKPITNVEHARLISLLEACWKYLDRVVAKAPAELRKGPRGGGRDRDKMFEHVLDAELEYGKGIGVRLKAPDRKALLAGFRNPKSDGRWPVAYAIRRTAWHALHHAWEMEDRSEPTR